MWPKKYRDYPVDGPLIKQQVTPGKGIIGCEMHEINGWGLSYHRSSHELERRKSENENSSGKGKGKGKGTGMGTGKGMGTTI